MEKPSIFGDPQPVPYTPRTDSGGPAEDAEVSTRRVVAFLNAFDALDFEDQKESDVAYGLLDVIRREAVRAHSAATAVRDSHVKKH